MSNLKFKVNKKTIFINFGRSNYDDCLQEGRNESTNILNSTEINMLKMGAFEYIIAC
jgi:hypothetical protein